MFWFIRCINGKIICYSCSQTQLPDYDGGSLWLRSTYHTSCHSHLCVGCHNPGPQACCLPSDSLKRVEYRRHNIMFSLFKYNKTILSPLYILFGPDNKTQKWAVRNHVKNIMKNFFLSYVKKFCPKSEVLKKKSQEWGRRERW